MTETTFGMRFDALPQLSRVRVLEEFEGPILSELRAEDGSRYLEKWCTLQDGAVRSLVVRSEHRAIAEYLAGRITLLSLFTKPNADVGFLVDSVRGTRKLVQLVQVSSLPANYLPKPTAKHDESLRPQWTRTTQAFLVDTKWDAKLLFELEKLYQTVFAFNYFTSADNGAPLPRAAETYVLDGGFSYWRMFSALRDSVPTNDNARSIGVMAASPGVLTLSAPTGTADRVVAALQAASREEVRKAYDNVHAWSKLPDKKADDVPTTALDTLRRLCDFLLVDVAKVLFARDEEPSKPQLLRAGKIVAAYYRQLWRILDPVWEGVEFLAPNIEPNATTPDDVYDDDEEDEDEAEDDYEE